MVWKVGLLWGLGDWKACGGWAGVGVVSFLDSCLAGLVQGFMWGGGAYGVVALLCCACLRVLIV
ncbi:hypothetical protein BDY21DRAFT_348747 [Lineolata rhizophorae]|uniref:Transmembrane protein n=1 Tax=Lineolata rhizophorae TaxID=578093 RepID=A0A6A6NX18_9PEZI|nr:hypothetical protein BDY21DRAFT_348747 [Lineolata rhizophorae]